MQDNFSIKGAGESCRPVKGHRGLEFYDSSNEVILSEKATLNVVTVF